VPEGEKEPTRAAVQHQAARLVHFFGIFLVKMILTTDN
jgi:hypothetical protein